MHTDDGFVLHSSTHHRSYADNSGVAEVADPFVISQ